jgi:RNA polymerase sigma factor (TIGR02999 family)
MRHVARLALLAYAAQRRAAKRGAGARAVPLESVDAVAAAVEVHGDTLAALDEALERPARLNPRQAQVVECRFFVGLSIEETAEALALSAATVKRDWMAARAWLNHELQT